MRTSDIIRFSLKKFGRSAWICAMLLALAFYLLLTSGNVLCVLSEQKAQPCELKVSSEGGVTDAFAKEISEIEHVSAVSAVIECSAVITAGIYTAEFEFTGISPEYINGSFISGVIFPANTAMPYIVINKAALKQFKDVDGKTVPKDADIDWLSLTASINTEKPVVSGICGIIDDGKDMPSAYISLSSAKSVFSIPYTGVLARIQNSGFEKSVSRMLSSVGAVAQNTNPERQTSWDMKEKELIYLLILGSFILLLTHAFMHILLDFSLIKHRAENEAMLLSGLSKRTILRIYRLFFALQEVGGLLAGLAGSAVVPSFIPADAAGSVFASPLFPMSVICCAALAALCFALLQPAVKKHMQPLGRFIKAF